MQASERQNGRKIAKSERGGKTETNIKGQISKNGKGGD